MNLGICKHEFKFTCRGYCRFTIKVTTFDFPGGQVWFALLIEKDGKGEGFILNAGVQEQKRRSHCVHRWSLYFIS